MLLKLTNSREKYDRRFQYALHVAIALCGRLMPDSEAIVKATSLKDESMPEELPEGLRDPLAILDRDRQELHSSQGLLQQDQIPNATTNSLVS